MNRVCRLAAALLGCLIGPLPGYAQSVSGRADLRSTYRAETIPFPADNPYTPAKERLGRLLFFDSLLWIRHPGLRQLPQSRALLEQRPAPWGERQRKAAGVARSNAVSSQHAYNRWSRARRS